MSLECFLTFPLALFFYFVDTPSFDALPWQSTIAGIAGSAAGCCSN